MRLTFTSILALSAAPAALGHTWIEQLRNVNSKGEYVGEYGYPRGMVSKTDPTFTGFSMNWELPHSENVTGGPYISASTTLCHPDQRKQVQSQEKYPRLKATPGGYMAMRYQENGHITKPDNQIGKPKKGGTVYVYGTTQPKEDEKLVDVLRWSQDGQGGDKRGVLLGMNDYDDGRCYEVNETPVSQERRKFAPNYAMGQVSDAPGNYPFFCETNAALPKDAPSGKPYTIYWVWQWNTMPDMDPGLPKGKDEYYTTCIDVDVVDVIAQDVKAQFALGPQQDANSKAVKGFASRKALKTDPIAFEMGPVFSSNPTATGSSPPATQSAQPPQTTLATRSISAPSSNQPGAPQVPTITSLPGGKPPSTQSQAPGAKPTDGPDDDNIVRITVTQRFTVTAPVAGVPTASARNKRTEYIARHGAKFRGVSFSD